MTDYVHAPERYTIVVGTDAKHIGQLMWVYQTWIKNKPSLLKQPMLLFADSADNHLLPESLIREAVPHPELKIVRWPDEGIVYPETVIDSKNKFGKAQRYKMMAGFVHVPARYVETEYWLKLDSDAVATGQDDWIDPDWFGYPTGECNIVGHRWGFTKPACLPGMLDEWVKQIESEFMLFTPALNLPLDSPESERISHPRISSWCAFFHTGFTRLCSNLASAECGEGMLPIPSQDTYLWYMATRFDPKSVVRVNMKSCGWTYRSSTNSVKELVQEVLMGEDRGI